MSNEIALSFDLEALLNKGKRNRKYKFEYLKDGLASYRILPSFDSANRRFEHGYALHWLTGENGKPVKALCTYYTEKFCPVCQAHKATKEAYEGAVKAAPQAENTKRLAAAMMKLSVARSTFYNAVNASGEPVILELNSTVSKALEVLIIEAYQKKNFDATALKGGVWFDFTKSGKGRDSVRVDYKRISRLVEGEMVDVLDRTGLSEELTNRLPTAVANLHDPKTMWIREYTALELGDYLKGKPLPDTNGRQTAAAPTSEEDSEESHAAALQAITNTVATPPNAQAAPAAVQATAPAPQASQFKDFAAEAERLQRLSNPQG